MIRTWCSLHTKHCTLTVKENYLLLCYDLSEMFHIFFSWYGLVKVTLTRALNDLKRCRHEQVTTHLYLSYLHLNTYTQVSSFYLSSLYFFPSSSFSWFFYIYFYCYIILFFSFLKNKKKKINSLCLMNGLLCIARLWSRSS